MYPVRVGPHGFAYNSILQEPHLPTFLSPLLRYLGKPSAKSNFSCRGLIWGLSSLVTQLDTSQEVNNKNGHVLNVIPLPRQASVILVSVRLDSQSE